MAVLVAGGLALFAFSGWGDVTRSAGAINVARVALQGLIRTAGSLSSGGADRRQPVRQGADRDDLVAGRHHLWREIIYKAIRKVAEKKAGVSMCARLPSPAGYLIALQATDRCRETSITGSIGVIFQFRRSRPYDNSACSL